MPASKITQVQHCSKGKKCSLSRNYPYVCTTSFPFIHFIGEKETGEQNFVRPGISFTETDILMKTWLPCERSTVPQFLKLQFIMGQCTSENGETGHLYTAILLEFNRLRGILGILVLRGHFCPCAGVMAPLDGWALRDKVYGLKFYRQWDYVVKSGPEICLVHYGMVKRHGGLLIHSCPLVWLGSEWGITCC